VHHGHAPVPTLASTVTSVAQGTTTYTYNAGNRLVVVTYPDDSRTTFGYNGEGKRLQVQEGAGTIKYLYDLDKVVLERDGAGNLLARYTHEGGSLYHDLVSMKRGGASYYFLFDGLGSVTEVVDGSENTQNSYRYEAWGQVQSSTENITNPYRYIGAYGVHWDSGPGLYFMPATYYMPNIGRMITSLPRADPESPWYWFFELKTWAELGPYFACFAGCMVLGVTVQPCPREVGVDVPTVIYFKHWRGDKRFIHGRFSKLIANLAPKIANALRVIGLAVTPIQAASCVHKCSGWIWI